MNIMLRFRDIMLISLLITASVFASFQTHASTLNSAKLDQMLAPVALYPDTVLTHILIASTYPLDIVEANRWLEQHTHLSAEEAVNAATEQDWDPSVIALLAFPDIIKRMNDDLSWTKSLGQAFLADEEQLLARIQYLRQKAYQQGTLENTEYIVVERQQNTIIIEPARPDIIYVPYYDSRVVYGNWWWPARPPVYWHSAAGYTVRNNLNWSINVAVTPWFYFTLFDWNHRHVIVNKTIYSQPPRHYPKRHEHIKHATRWQHHNKYPHRVYTQPHQRQLQHNRKAVAPVQHTVTRPSSSPVQHDRRTAAPVQHTATRPVSAPVQHDRRTAAPVQHTATRPVSAPVQHDRRTPSPVQQRHAVTDANPSVMERKPLQEQLSTSNRSLQAPRSTVPNSAQSHNRPANNVQQQQATAPQRQPRTAERPLTQTPKQPNIAASQQRSQQQSSVTANDRIQRQSQVTRRHE